jgi:hypothetical protein
MTRHPHSFRLLAVALAASVMVAACGGGDPSAPADTVAPTLAITSSAAGTTATGVMTFTFTFSEDVGTSFTVEDVVVTGGTAASTVTKTDATHYTLLVTPTANASGTVSVSVAAAKFSDIANNANTATAALDQAYNTVVAATEPTTAAATPTALAANVLSIYSDAYTPVAGVTLRPDWGQSTVVSEVVIAGNKTEKYTAFNYEGITFTPIDITAMSKMHIDVWTPDLTALDVFVLAGGAEQSVQLKPTKAGWNSFDINLADYTTLNKAAVKELKLVATGGSTAYLDNIYFWKAAAPAPVDCGTTEPTCAPTTVIPAGSLTIYSEATTATGFDAFPNWGQATQYSEATLAGNKSLKYSNLNYEGMQFDAVDVSGKSKVHFDLWTPGLTSVQISLISPGKENPVTQVLTTKGWNSVDIDLSKYTTPNLAGIFQIKLEATGSGTLYVDNIYFWGTAVAAPPGSTPNPTAAAGSAGPVTIPVLTAAMFGDFGATGDAVFAGDYAGAVDSNGNHAKWDSATTKGAANNGNIGYFQDSTLSTSAQKLEENGWVAGLIDNAGGVPSFFRYYILTKPASTFASSYVGLFANAPNNGTVDVSSRGSIKFRLWGPAEMYQDPAFSPTLEMKLTGPKIAGCTATGSGATEIKKNFLADQKIGAASTYKLSLAGWSVVGVCGTDTAGTAVASVLSKLAQVVVTVPGSSFNFTHQNVGGTQVTYTTGVNLGPIIFTTN